MPENQTQSGFHPRWPAQRLSKLHVIIVLLTAAVWLIDPLIDSLIGVGTYTDSFFSPGTHELYMRATMSLIVLVFGEICIWQIQTIDAQKRSLEHFQSILQNTSEQMALLDGDLVHLQTNRSYLEAHGLAALDVVGLSLTEVFGQSFYDSVLAEPCQECLAGQIVEFDTWVEPIGHERERYHAHFLLIPWVGDQSHQAGIVLNIKDTTSEKRAEHQLQEREAYFRMLVENAPVCIHEINRDGELISMNPAGLSMMHMEDEQNIQGLRVLNAVCEEDRKDVARLLQLAWEGEPAYFEFRARSQNGYRYYESSFIPIFDDQGQVYRMMGITQSQTRRKLSELALKKNESYLRFLYENNPSMYFTLSTKGTILSVNQNVSESLGYAPKELIGHSVFQLFDADSQAVAREKITLCLANPGEVLEWEIPKNRKDGSQMIVKESSCAVESPNGETVLLIVCRDITEKYQAEQKLQASEARYRAVVEDMPVLVGTYLKGGELTFVNRAYCQYFQMSEANLLGKSFLDLIPESDRLMVSENIASLTPDNPIRTHEHQVIAPDGTIRWQRWVNRAMFDTAGELLMYHAIGEDVTERKQSQMALLQRTNLLQENQKTLLRLAKEEFPDAASAFHKIVATSARQLGIGHVSLWLFNEDESQLQCMASSNDEAVAQQQLMLNREDLPNYFRALEESYVAEEHARTAASTWELKESYLVPNHVFSLLDVPVRVDGKMIGIVCHEYMNEPHAWSVEEIEFANSISDLVAVIHAGFERSRLEDLMTAIKQTTELEIGQAFFNQLTRSLASTLKVKYAFVGQVVDDRSIETLSVWAGDDWVENFGYELENTPCQNVTVQSTCIYPKQVAQLFPEDHLLVEMGVESYLGTPLRSPEGKVIGLLVVLHNEPIDYVQMMVNVIEVFAQRAGSELVRQQDLLEMQKLTRALEHSATAIVMTDTQGKIEYVNPVFARRCGFDMEEIKQKHIQDFQVQAEAGPDWEEVSHAVAEHGDWKGDVCRQHRDGTAYWDRQTVSAVRSLQGEVTHYMYILEDVTRELELSEQLKYQAKHDSLTGLMNRSEFERLADKILEGTKRHPSEHALCFMDLDQFKVVNDTCGHSAGDELLRQIVQVFDKKVRKADVVARLGGDEFGILMRHCNLEQAKRAAEAIQKSIQEFQFAWGEQVFRIGVSMGLVPITHESMDFAELLKQADSACYVAKDLGRNRIHVYHPDDRDLVRRSGEMQWVSRIHKALDEDRMVLFAQPIVPLKGQRKTASRASRYELLVRMMDEDGQLIPPGAFLPAAERYHLMQKLDGWVIKKTFQYLIEQKNFVRTIQSVSINLSGQSMASQEILDLILSQVKQTGIRPEKLCFEITETAAISNLKLARSFISEIRKLGCKFSLDDFGSGLSSFAYLKNLDVDYLKIDGMFVRNIASDSIDHAMVKSINEIGQVMGMETIAEFVEDDEIKGMLREIGVDYAQGYGIGHPEPLEQLIKQFNNIHVLKRS